MDRYHLTRPKNWPTKSSGTMPILSKQEEHHAENAWGTVDVILATSKGSPIIALVVVEPLRLRPAVSSTERQRLTACAGRR